MTYIKFNAVDDEQACEEALAYANEIGLLPVVVLTDTGEMFSSYAQIRMRGICFESDSWEDGKIGNVVAWLPERGNRLTPTVPDNPIQQILNWFKTAKPEPTEKDKATQIGAHFEEVAEMQYALSAGSSATKSLSSSYYMSDGIHVDEDGRAVKLPDNWKEQLLDSCGDQIVTNVGVAYMLGMDIEGALAEIIRSNNSKFVDGKAIKNEHGKIIKGENYTPPNLKPFLNNGE